MTKYRIGKVAPTPKGVYDETVRYAKLDFVTDESGNSLYMSKVDDNIGHTLTDTDYWMQCLDASEQMAIINSAVEDIEESVETVQTLAEESEQTIQELVNGLDVTQTTGDSASKVMSQKAVTDEVGTIKDAFIKTVVVERFSLTGNNNTLVTHFATLDAGTTYILTTDMDTSCYTSTQIHNINVYSLAPFIDGAYGTPLFTTIKSVNVPLQSFTFTATEAEYYSIGIRANKNKVVNFVLYKIDESLLLPHTSYDILQNAKLSGKEIPVSSCVVSKATNPFQPSGYLKTRLRCIVKVPIIPCNVSVRNIPAQYVVSVQSNATLADGLSARVNPIDNTPWGETEHTFTDANARYVGLTVKIGSAGTAEWTDADIETFVSSVKLVITPWDDKDINNDEYYLNNAILQDHGWSGTNYTDKTPPATFLHFSDLHGNVGNLLNIVNFKNKYNSFLLDAVGTGDLVRDTLADDWTFWNAAGAQNIIQTTGNHEYYVSAPSYATATSLQVYNKFFGNINLWGVTQPANAAANGYCYYYKDYANYKLRAIFLDSLINTSAQCDWVENLLNDVLANHSDYHVIFFGHTAPFHKTGIACSFQTLSDWDSYFSWRDFMDLIADKVDAFIGNGGHFVAWITGHTHRDMLCTLNEHPNQLYVSIGCATDMSDWTALERGTDMYREINTPSMDLFNIIVVDTANNRIKLKRIGADVDRDLRHKGSLVYDYANMSLIYDD